jgi:peroxiredoxin
MKTVTRNGFVVALGLALCRTTGAAPCPTPVPAAPTTPTVIVSQNNSLPGDATERTPLAAGRSAIDFELPLAELSVAAPGEAVDARHLHLNAARAAHPGVTILIFWAFWCDTWKDTTGEFRVMRRKLADEKAYTCCVVVDSSQQTVAESAFRKGDIWFPVAIDADSKVTAAYGARRVPTFFILDRDGIVRNCFESFPGEHVFMEAVRAAAAKH